jgi:hypothetical protein
MSILQPAQHQMAFGKVGFYGDTGSGKTFTAVCTAIGLYKFAKCTKPIGFFDTEPALSYVLPLFEAAGIKVLSCVSRSFSDLMTFMDEAERECDISIIDSVTHPWRDIQKSYMDKTNDLRKQRGQKSIQKLEFHHWGPIKDEWGKFTDKFLSSKMHVIICGRASSIYEYQTNDQGKKELITNGTKMATEKELGHEPSLLIEMIKHRENGRIINRAFIEKDRSNILNGNEIDFQPHKGVDLEKINQVFEKIRPHFEHLNLNGKHFDSLNQRDSKDLYPDVDADEWPSEQRQRTILSEEIQGLIVKHYPGQTVEEKKCKADLLERFFNTRSWTKISENTPSQILKEALHKMRMHLDGPVAQEEPQEKPSQEGCITLLMQNILLHELKDTPERLTNFLAYANVEKLEDMKIEDYNTIIDQLRDEKVVLSVKKTA